MLATTFRSTVAWPQPPSRFQATVTSSRPWRTSRQTPVTTTAADRLWADPSPARRTPVADICQPPGTTASELTGASGTAAFTAVPVWLAARRAAVTIFVWIACASFFNSGVLTPVQPTPCIRRLIASHATSRLSANLNTASSRAASFAVRMAGRGMSGSKRARTASRRHGYFSPFTSNAHRSREDRKSSTARRSSSPNVNRFLSRATACEPSDRHSVRSESPVGPRNPLAANRRVCPPIVSRSSGVLSPPTLRPVIFSRTLPFKGCLRDVENGLPDAPAAATRRGVPLHRTSTTHLARHPAPLGAGRHLKRWLPALSIKTPPPSSAGVVFTAEVSAARQRAGPARHPADPTPIR